MLIEEIKNIKSDNADCRKFGISVGIVLIVISLVLSYYDKNNFIYFGTIGGLLVIFGVIIPQVLKPLQKIWMAFAVILGFIMTRVILTILFYLIVTPTGFIARLFGKDFLDLKLEKEKDSYWHLREIKEYQPLDTERQF